MNLNQANNDQLRLGGLATKIAVPALIIGLLGLAVSVIFPLVRGGENGWEQLFRSYLTSFIFVLTLSLGALFFVLIQHLTRAGWSVVIRRLAEAVAANLTWLWILFVPVVYIMMTGNGAILYDWADPTHLRHDPVLKAKSPFLNPEFWSIRAVVYFLIWGLAGYYFYRNSVKQDETGDVQFTHRLQRWAPIAVILYALTQTFASIDWIMSLEAHWFSTMFGVYFFAGSCCGFFALLCVMMYFTQRFGKLTNEISFEHYQDAGKLLFAFGVVFWAYIAFSQYMLIWYANIPEETGWYIARQLGAWKTVSIVLLAGHFVLPFLLLITKHTKRAKLILTLIALWMLLMHFVDVYWLVMPHVPADALANAQTYQELEQLTADSGSLGFAPHLLDLTCLVGMLGVFIAITALRLRKCALMPMQDPRLSESLSFENI